MSDVIKFKRQPIKEWPTSVYLADFGDGDGCRPYRHIQYYDDTTPEYVRVDLYMAQAARIAALEAKFAEAVEAIETMQAQAAGTPNHPFCAMVIETGNDALARLRDGEGE